MNAVELLPIFQFDPQTAPPGLTNYWGYQTVSFFAPHMQYAVGRDATAAVDEFRDLVKALHRAGIEVILDVVYNHTAEAASDGPTLSFRGLANDDYYLLDPDDRAEYADYTGCGNTTNANGPVVRRLIRDSLRYWVHDMHVDGFRFDLASVFSRDETGLPIPDPPILYDIESDPVLAGTRLIAEAWDAGGLYQVGHFAGDRWVEWNGRFRDDVRSFVRGDPGMGWPLVQRFTGSPDLYGHKDPDTESSLNFVTCHDGFTLHDLVAYDEKHNDANGEGGRDGSDLNVSWNHGVEGPTDDPEILRLRARQVRNFLAFDLLSVGVPMVLMGDEAGRTQDGQQQRVRARRPDQLVRLDVAGARGGSPAVHEGPHRPATAAARSVRDRRTRAARRPPGRARPRPGLSLHRDDVPIRAAGRARHLQRVLGRTRLRVAGPR